MARGWHLSLLPNHRAWVERLQPGEQVSSGVTGDVGDVLARDPLGLRVRWRVGVTEFVLFSESGSLQRRSWRRPVRVARVLPEEDDTPLAEQEQVRQRIAEVRAEKRARGELCNPAYAIDELEVAHAG